MKNRKEKWTFGNVLALITAITVVSSVLAGGVNFYQPYKEVEAIESARIIREQAEERERRYQNHEQIIEEMRQKINGYKKVVKDSTNYTKIRKAKAQVMEEYLAENGGVGGKMEHRANDYINICEFEDIGLESFLLWAISMQETGNGWSKAIMERNNVGGLFIGGRLDKRQSVYRGITEMAIQIRYNGYYDNVPGLYTGNITDRTIEAMGNIYCPIGAANDPTGLNKHWVPNVKRHYNELVKRYDKKIEELGL
jgi:hypothetical protein